MHHRVITLPLKRTLTRAFFRAPFTRTPQLRHGFAATTSPELNDITSDNDFDTIIIGGGVIGLSIAHHLASHRLCPSPSRIVLLERHNELGTETSSRNSEVVHAGLYYPPDSLKTALCIRGRELLLGSTASSSSVSLSPSASSSSYSSSSSFCERHGVGHARVGKWIVAQDAAQTAGLARLVAKMKRLEAAGHAPTPLRWVSRAEAERVEPDVRVNWEWGGAVIESSATGIVSAHELMQALEGLFLDRGGLVCKNTRVLALMPADAEPDATRTATARLGRHGWQVMCLDEEQLRTQELRIGSFTAPKGAAVLGTRDPRMSEITLDADSRGPVFTTATIAGNDSKEITNFDICRARTVINAAGLEAHHIANMVLPPDRHYALRYAKGSYFSWAPPAGTSRPNRLIYPAPIPGAPGLGTHLTLDLAGRIRFGPDAEWQVKPDPRLTVTPEQIRKALRLVNQYMPHVQEQELQGEYAGIRPKLVPARGPEAVAKEGQVSEERGKQTGGSVMEGKGFVDFHICKEDGYENWINLLGIESPGLTSSLAIGEMVAKMVYEGEQGQMGWKE